MYRDISQPIEMLTDLRQMVRLNNDISLIFSISTVTRMC
jgi:hypothetical protein